MKDKKSFLLYCDLIHTIEKMPKEQAGELFCTILKYVNDQNPKVDDLVVSLVFEPIKQQLKRDLLKYNSLCERNSANGAKGGRPKKAKKPTGLNGLQEKPRKADNDSDTDKVIDNDKDIYIKISKSFFLTNKEFNILIEEGYPKNLIESKVEAMANTKGIEKKYVSFVKTLRNWLKKDHQSKENKPKFETNR